jgi:tetratricopeptide (TPR) repeat protein
LAGKNPHKHHFWNVFLKTAASLMLFFFLNDLFTPKIAWFTTLLFIVSPCGTQAVAWISGKGFIIGLFWGLLALQSIKLPIELGFKIIIFIISSILAGFGNITMLALPLITFYLGYPMYTILGILISIGLGISMLSATFKLRKKTFEEQNLIKSKLIHWRKIIVAFKTLFYYTKHSLFPFQMGLYHTWHFHQTDAFEKEDNDFWLGILTLLGFMALFYYGNPIVKFGIIWYFAFIFAFLNWVTFAQIVTERYPVIASIGLWLVIANYLVNYPIIFAFILGLYLMRTWLHLPTYSDEIGFYISNIWNYPKSEIALANLAAVYLRRGMAGAAVDFWNICIGLNKDYDVPYYNLYSIFRAQRQYQIAKDYLLKAINAPTCHFKKTWEKELQDFDKEVLIFNQIIKLWQEDKQKAVSFIGEILQKLNTEEYKDHFQKDVFKAILEKDLEGMMNFLNPKGVIKCENVNTNSPTATIEENISKSQLASGGNLTTSNS